MVSGYTYYGELQLMKNATLGMYEILCTGYRGQPFVLERLYGSTRQKVDRLASKWQKKMKVKVRIERMI